MRVLEKEKSSLAGDRNIHDSFHQQTLLEHLLSGVFCWVLGMKTNLRELKRAWLKADPFTSPQNIYPSPSDEVTEAQRREGTASRLHRKCLYYRDSEKGHEKRESKMRGR